MRRRFNITGSCNPKRHYMVNLDDRLRRIKEDYVDEGSYFIINRGRQYGKTTTLKVLEEYLKDDYIVLSLDFQEIGTEDFVCEAAFVNAFVRTVVETFYFMDIDQKEELPLLLTELMEKPADQSMMNLFIRLNRMCAKASKPVVLMIDEVDSAANNQVFSDFLAQLRSYYLKRDKVPIFHSVILAGVYDIKNLKLKLRPEAEHQYNSPWNIAAKFKLDMNFSAEEIAVMLKEYEKDYHTGMDIRMVSGEIFEYTSGYPVLVSAICKYIDEDLSEEENIKEPKDIWSKEGVGKAVKKILIDDEPLFESMIRHLNDFPEMKRMFRAILFQGNEFAYSPDTKEINLACMFGYAVNKEGKVQIANRIFETRLYNYFLSEEELSSAIGKMAQRDKGYFIHEGRLDMDMVMRKFVEYFTEIYGGNDEKFVESHGRKLFLLYLKPIINGVGNYYIEAQTRDARRTDVIVDYRGERFVVELKIWHGNEYNERGEEQLADYLNYFHADKGYMLSFNFNKKKHIGVRTIMFGNKAIVEAVV
ncbi:MAG: ATP-binding protein [Lachnospiraceae bacterium]|nr:ATP-binding protein [Lachnospiraceae bacterium]